MSFRAVASSDPFAVPIFFVLSQDRWLELPHRLVDLPACPKDLESRNKTVNVPTCCAVYHLKHSACALIIM